MLNDSAALRDFYQSPKGQGALDLLRAHAGKIWPAFSNERILPLGCASVLLNSPLFVSGRMTSQSEENFSCLVDAKNKPLPDGDIDRILALHIAPSSQEMALLLREAWRVLKGEGRILIIVPRRCGFWAQNSDTPFGKEEAYSAPQIRTAFSRQGFAVTRVRRALFLPPCCLEKYFPLARTMEGFAPFLFYGGGVLLIEGQKRVLGFAGAKKRQQQTASNPLLPLPLPI